MREHLRTWLMNGAIYPLIAVPVLLAWLGPFGTYSEMSFGPRLLYWTVLGIGVGLMMMVAIAFFRTWDRANHLSATTQILIGTALAAIPSALLVFYVRGMMRDPPLAISFLSLIKLWSQVWIISALIGTGEHFRMNFLAPPGEPIKSPDPSNSDTAPRGPILAQTKLHTRLAQSGHPVQTIVSLSMQDHYVTVHSDTGEQLVLMRLTDAIEELDGLPGLRVHRSHWAARDQMKELSRDGHRWWLHLEDGRELPVSQTYLEDVQEALGNGTTVQ